MSNPTNSKPAKNHPWAVWNPGKFAAKPGPASTEPYPVRLIRKAGSIR